jgi:hypothetical protein
MAELKLTHANYYTPDNLAISNSKVSDFLRSKEYFYKRHITHELEFKPTTPIKIGRIVDAIVSKEKIRYEVKVLKRDDPVLFEFQKSMPDDAFVTEDQLYEGQMRAQAITREPFYQEYLTGDATFQPILEAEIEVDGEMVPICGMADVMLETADTIFIDDCKSVSPMKVKTTQHWYWNCRDMGYFRQMGAYAKMVSLMRRKAGLPQKEIVCRHFVVTKEMDGLYRVHLFVIPTRELVTGAAQFVEGVRDIVREKDWFDPPVTWDSAVPLIQPQQEEDYADEEEGFE